MLNIIGHDLSAVDKDNIKKIFSYTPLSKNKQMIIDLKYVDFEIDDYNTIFAIGKVATRLIVRELVKGGKISQSVFVGNDLYNQDAGFMFVNVGLEVVDIMTSQENKDFMWDKVSNAVDLYLKINPDDITAGENEVVKETIVIDSAVVDDAWPDTGLPKSNAPAVIQPIGDNVTYQVGDILDKLYEHVSLSDPSLGKMLSKYEKFTLHTTSGDLNIYPTTRMPDSDEDPSITFKDLVVLLKYFTIMNAEHVTLKKKDGNITD